MAGKGIIKKYNSKAEVEGRERIFGDKKAVRGSWVVDPATGKLVPKGEYVPQNSTFKNLEPFKSPITGELITCRKQLREHNKQHGVTNIKDYSPEHFKKKGEERVREFHGSDKKSKQERIKIINREAEKKGIRW
jgi:hypothetical protein